MTTGTFADAARPSRVLLYCLPSPLSHPAHAPTGDIKAANVLVNDSFDCKLSDFGLSSTKGRVLGAGRRSAVGTPFWMAPELLAGESNSEASDVYGLGMLCWECFARDVPYADHKGKSTRDILLEVRSDETKLRPTISAEMRRSAPTGVVQLIEDCLLHNPDRRPSLEEIDAALDRMQSSGGTNRTPLRKADLFDPAANTRRSMLLDRMLPPDVAARLTRGEKVGALRYEHATIFFCDIVNFTEIGDQLGDPEDVAAMLDRLYSRFDSLVREFGVFKLETIGDCYMVAGGVAREQPRTHAARVAAFALAAIDEAAATLVCERRPELGTLRIRAGAHVGPVVGGLVGSDKLKFSVYGDTVNTASRCESNSEAQTLTTTDAGAAALREQASVHARESVVFVCVCVYVRACVLVYLCAFVCMSLTSRPTRAPSRRRARLCRRRGCCWSARGRSRSRARAIWCSGGCAEVVAAKLTAPTATATAPPTTPERTWTSWTRWMTPTPRARTTPTVRTAPSRRRGAASSCATSPSRARREGERCTAHTRMLARAQQKSRASIV